MPVPSALLSALSVSSAGSKPWPPGCPDPDDDEVERLIAPVRDELRRLADELERRRE